MSEKVSIENNDIYLADPEPIPECDFIGREPELNLCRAAWGMSSDSPFTFVDELESLNFRLQGPPGVGKNEIVYQLARDLDMDLYIIPGHEELTPEDLALVLVPDATSEQEQAANQHSARFVLRASPLATAIYRGGLVFFDEINRVPERALSPLASVLDGRKNIFSAMSGITIHPRDERAKKSFRFCCALNPALSDGGHVLPDYIEQRTLPVIEVAPLKLKDLITVLRKNLKCPKTFESAFEEWFNSSTDHQNISVREAKSLVNFAMRFTQQQQKKKKKKSYTPLEAITFVAPQFIKTS